VTIATDITIVGAGPYGLSIAAHLRERGANFRIIGSPMQSWLSKMPKGMLLKSEACRLTLYDPGSTFTLRRFCKDQGLPYQGVGLPVSVETFSSYGIAFQKHIVPKVEDTHLVALRRCPEGFELSMADGKSITTRKVVLATGLDSHRHIPEPLVHLPRELLTHSAEHHDLARFRGRDVVVIGGSSSAIDLAVLLHEGLANVQVIARKPTISFRHMDMAARPLLQHIRASMAGIGPGWKGLQWTDAPWLYRYLLNHFRIRMAKKFLGPCGGGFMEERFSAVPKLLGFQLLRAEALDGRVELLLSDPDGNQRQVSTEHVIAATGYIPDVRRLSFLSPEIVERLQLIGQTPRLSAHFESSVPGLYFVGAISATSFGPTMGFVAGADFTSQRISKHLTRSSRRTLFAVPRQASAMPGTE